MHTTAQDISRRPGAYHGLRLTAQEYFALPDDGGRYELIDGVAVMSPSPTVRHQRIAGEVYFQLAAHVRARRLGVILYEIDVFIGRRPDGRDIVYRPEIIFLRANRGEVLEDRVHAVPDLVVEVVSPASRSLDTKTKYEDYERAGVGEYWLIDPERDAFSFYRLMQGRFIPVDPSVDRFDSAIVTGFGLNLSAVRAVFRSSR